MNSPSFSARMLLIALLAALPAAAIGEHPPEETLIVFVNPEDASVHPGFAEKWLPRIRDIAGSMETTMETRTIEDGAPAEVGITPLIVYQNYKGRSIYQGRYTTLDRVRNFIRTSRFMAQGDAPLERQQTAVWTTGRARIWAPLKIAPVTGAVPKNHDHEAFVRESVAAIARGFERFTLPEVIRLGRADRGFYMDFYPWRAEDGTLYLSLALYSQFHCKTPVFEKKKPPLIGSWEKRDILFAEGGKLMEQAVARQIAAVESGDAFSPVPSDVPAVSWERLGLALPEAPERKTSVSVDISLGREWRLGEPGTHAPSLVRFRFPAPLDQYAGEVMRGRGRLTLGENRTVDGGDGFVEMDPASVTMGFPDLDKALQGGMFLATRKHGPARFEAATLSGDGRPLAFGRLVPGAATGTFTLKGISIPLTVPLEFEPVIDENARPRLLVKGGFSIDLNTFSIEGADGPAPANHTLLIDLNLAYEPVEK